MNSFNGYPSPGYAPSAPPISDPSSAGGGYAQPYASGYGYQLPSNAYPSFPPGTRPEVMRAFQAVDRDGSGSIDEWELQAVLSLGDQRFSHRTVRLLVFHFANSATSSKIGPPEFAALWTCLGQWLGLMEKFKAKDPCYTGSATLTYDDFMKMVIPFLVEQVGHVLDS